jgi:poly-gamma-glutamate capsule biosynthesis protein CapA/YwtB (metallophosphatase superfamily)
MTPPDRRRPSADEGFTVATVGDLLVSRPVSMLGQHDVAFGDVVDLLRRADATFGNFETTLLDARRSDGEPQGWEDEWPVHSDPELAVDLRAMGFDVLGRANNHGMDWGRGSLIETDRLLTDAGLVHAGAGTSASSARSPRYLDRPRGRLGVVSVTTSPAMPGAAAVDAVRGAPGRAGVNVINTRRIVVVPPDLLRRLEEILDVVPELDTRWIPLTPEDGHRVELGHLVFVEGAAFEERYELDEESVIENLRSVRLAKQHADVCLFAIHAHQGDQRPETPRAFLRDLAHAAVDAGADIVAISGPHRMAPVELYGEGVVLYGLGNFFWHVISEPLQPYLYRDAAPWIARRFPDAASVTDLDIDRWMNGEWEEDAFFDATLANVTFEDGALGRVELHPVALSRSDVPARAGLPRRADDASARRIVEGIAAMSAPFGTTVRCVNGVGVVLPAQTA